MFNLLRMELRRLIRSKSPYVALLWVLGILLMAGITMRTVSDPELAAEAARKGMEITVEDQDEFDKIMEGSLLQSLYTGIYTSGGAVVIALYIVITLMVCSDYDSGFAKNIFSLRHRRGGYVISWMIAMQILSLILNLAAIGFWAFFVRMAGMRFSSNSLQEYLWFLLLFQAIGGGFCAQAMAFALITRSKAFGAVASLVMCGGIAAALIETIFGLKQVSVMKWTLYGTSQSIVFPIQAGHVLAPFGIALVWMVFWIAVGVIVVQKRDV